MFMTAGASLLIVLALIHNYNGDVLTEGALNCDTEQTSSLPYETSMLDGDDNIYYVGDLDTCTLYVYTYI